MFQLLGGALRGAFQHGLGQQVGHPSMCRILQEQAAAEAKLELDDGGLAVFDAQDAQAVGERLAPRLRGAYARRGPERWLGGTVERPAGGAVFAPYDGERGLGPLHDGLLHDFRALGPIERQLRLAAGHEAGGDVRPVGQVGAVRHGSRRPR